MPGSPGPPSGCEIGHFCGLRPLIKTRNVDLEEVVHLRNFLVRGRRRGKRHFCVVEPEGCEPEIGQGDPAPVQQEIR